MSLSQQKKAEFYDLLAQKEGLSIQANQLNELLKAKNDEILAALQAEQQPDAAPADAAPAA